MNRSLVSRQHCGFRCQTVITASFWCRVFSRPSRILSPCARENVDNNNTYRCPTSDNIYNFRNAAKVLLYRPRNDLLCVGWDVKPHSITDAAYVMYLAKSRSTSASSSPCSNLSTAHNASQHQHCHGSMTANTHSMTVNNYMVGSVAQWLGRRYLAVGLSLIYAWSIVDIWPLRGKGVHYGSTNQTNSAFHPSGVGKWIVIHVITSITGVETIKRPTRVAYGWLVVGQSEVTGLAYCLQAVRPLSVT